MAHKASCSASGYEKKSVRYYPILTLNPKSLVARRISPGLSQRLLMPFAVGAVCSTPARTMQGQGDHGPVATAVPRAVPFPPAFSLPQSQHYGLPLRPLEPPPQGFAPSYPHPRPEGKRNRPRKGKNAQERRRRSSKNAATKPGLSSMLKANRQRTRKHFPRKCVNCTCCGHLKALYCLGPGSCADTDGLCDTGLAETPKDLTHGVPCDVSHLAIYEALKPGTYQLFYQCFLLARCTFPFWGFPWHRKTNNILLCATTSSRVLSTHTELQ